MLQVVNAMECTKATFAQSVADQTQRIQSSQKETQLTVLEALRISDGEAAVRHNAARHTQQSSVDGLSQQLYRICRMQSSSAFSLDDISRNTEDIKAAITASNAYVPTILQPMVEAAVQRSLTLSRTAFKDSTSEQSGSRTMYPADGTLPVTGLATKRLLLQPDCPSFSAFGPKRQRTRRASHPYRFGSVTITQRDTQRIDNQGTKSSVLDAKQITIVVSFNAWFLKMALAIEYGTATPSLGEPLLRLQLRAFYMVENSSPVVQAINAGNVVKFRQLLVDRKATPFDRLPNGLSLFYAVVVAYSHSLSLEDEAWRALELLKMAEVLLESGADCEGSRSFGYITFYGTQKQAETCNTMARMIVSNCKDDPFHHVQYCGRMHQDLKALIVGQEHWDTTELENEFNIACGEGAWQRIMVEGCDLVSWLVERSVAWKREPRQVKSSETATRKTYGQDFCTDRWVRRGVSVWLRLQWRELRSSVRHSLQASGKELGVHLSARQFEVLCDEERWKKEPAEVKMSKVKARGKYGTSFAHLYYPGHYIRWECFSSWDYLTREEQLLGKDRADSCYNEDSDDEGENSDKDDNSESSEGFQSGDTKPVGVNSDDGEYETADEG